MGARRGEGGGRGGGELEGGGEKIWLMIRLHIVNRWV